MPDSRWYRVLLHGQTLSSSHAANQLEGFYATRFVEASTEQDAAQQAMRSLLSDPELLAMQASGLVFDITNEEITLTTEHVVSSGFTFYGRVGLQT